MSTLLENPAAKSPVAAPIILRSSHRWLRWRGVLIVGTFGLAVTLIVLWTLPAKWHTADPEKELALIWIGGLLLTALAAAIIYRLSPRSLLISARRLDERYGSRNRLEAVAVLHDSTSPLAQAQREETARYLDPAAHVRSHRLFSWLLALFLALVVAHLTTLAIWFMPIAAHMPGLLGKAAAHAQEAKAKAKAAQKPPADTSGKSLLPKEAPKASITWVSPEAETKANPIEEVPTVATAKSTSGLQGLALEVSLNGVPAKSTPIPAEPFNKAGSHDIKVSIYLDDVGAQPYDVVSYYLHGQRISDTKVPETTSAIQFIQVRPFRDDVLQGSGHSNKGYDLLIRLKLAQLRAVKENFVLAHTDLPPDEPVRVKENERVGKNQAALSAKTEEVVQAFIAGGAPPEMIDLLRQAEPPMDDAAKKILATQNNEALAPQQKALDFIIEVEKFFHKGIGRVTGPSSPNPNDPFKDKQKHELTKRMNEPSGQLETLLKFQTHLSQDLDHPGSDTPAAEDMPANPDPTAPKMSVEPTPDYQALDPFAPESDKGTYAERQTHILQGIAVIQNDNKVFPDTVMAALANAQRDATDSERQLALNQNQDAREPAAAAERDLQDAVNAMYAAGDEETKEAMDDAKQKLDDLASQLRELAGNPPPDAPAKLKDMAAQVAATQEELNRAADHQQEAGSAKGAEQLARLAEKLRQQQFASQLAQMSQNQIDPGRASALADQLEAAAHGTVPADPHGQDYAKLINDLERSRANVERLAEMAAQMPSGATPGTQPTPGQMPGMSPGQQSPLPTPGQGQAQGQGQSQQPSQGQSPGQAQSQSQQPGQGQGQGQGRQPGQGQGQGQGQANGSGSGSGTRGQSQGSGRGGPRSDSPNPRDGNPTAPGPNAPFDPSAPVTSTTLEAYHEALENLNHEVQQSSEILHAESPGGVGSVIRHYQQAGGYRDVTAVDMIHFYADLQKPLDNLIVALEDLEQHAQRTEFVKMPNLDDTPEAYRSAVSDYFESISRDYHPPPAPPPTPPKADTKP